jgi:hypothetical protein
MQMRRLAPALAVLLLATLAFTPAPASAAQAEAERWQTFDGWVVTRGADHLDLRVQGYGTGPNDLVRFQLVDQTRIEAALMADVSVTVLAWQQHGTWYAASITPHEEEDGNEMVPER